MNLANDLISRGISMGWLDVDDISTRPNHIQKQDYVPCALFLLQNWTYTWCQPQEDR
jgi:hypothetical protein